MSLTVSFCCWLSLTFSSSAIELLRPWYLSVSHCLSQCHGVAACLSLSPIVSGYLSLPLQSHGVVGFFSLPPMVAGFLSLSLPVPRICCTSLTVSHCCWLSLTIPYGPIELLNVSHCNLLLLAVSDCLSQCHGVDACLLLSPMVARFHSSFPVSLRICMSLTISHGSGFLSLSLRSL